MSLREQSLDLLFNEFVNTYFTHSPVVRELILTQTDKPSPTQKSGTSGTIAKKSTDLTGNLSLRELLASSATARLYESTHQLLRSMLKEVTGTSVAKKSKSAKEVKNTTNTTGATSAGSTEGIAGLLRSHWKLSRLYVFKVEQTKSSNKVIVPVYMYPAKVNSKTLQVNNSFVNQLKNPKNQHEIGESIKHFFDIVTPRLEFLPNAGGESWLVFYEHPMVPLVSTALVNRLINEILLTHAHYRNLPVSAYTNAGKNTSTKLAQTTKQNFSATNISTSKVYLYQRVVSQLLALTGDSLTELEAAIQFLFQIGGLTQVLVTDDKNTLIAVYSMVKPSYNVLKSGKQAPETLLKEYDTAEVANRARTIPRNKKNMGRSNKKAKSTSTHFVKLFTKKAMHPQKQSPDFPFNHYIELLERLLAKRAMIKS